MKKLSILLALILSAPLLSVSAAEDILYVMSARAKILANPSFDSETIQNVIKGEKLINIEKKNNWYKVRYGDKVGWLSRLSVSYHPPMKRKRRMASVDKKLLKNSRRRASSVSTTAAVRGLRSIDRSRVNGQNILDYASVKRMESFNIADDEIYSFMDGIRD